MKNLHIVRINYYIIIIIIEEEFYVSVCGCHWIN